MAVWRAGRLEGRKGRRLESWKVGRLEGWKVGRLEGWKVKMLEGWKVGRLEAVSRHFPYLRDFVVSAVSRHFWKRLEG